MQASERKKIERLWNSKRVKNSTGYKGAYFIAGNNP